MIKSLQILSGNKEDLQTLISLGLTAKVIYYPAKYHFTCNPFLIHEVISYSLQVMLWFEVVHDVMTSDLHRSSTSLLNLVEEFYDYFLVRSMLGKCWSVGCRSKVRRD